MEQTPEHVRGCYNAVAREYAEKFSGELEHKPLDRELLRRFAAAVGSDGPVYDFGCGPGHTTAFLHACGVTVRGLDLSPELLAEARARHPHIPFEVGDMLALPLAGESVAGVVAFYAIVHSSADQLRTALGEMRRVLRPGGLLLLSFHIGDAAIHVEEFLGRTMSLDFTMWRPEQVTASLGQAGFDAIEVIEREPYPGVEHPTRRAYVFARAGREAE